MQATAEPPPEIGLARQLMQGQAGAFDRFVDHFRKRIFQYSWLMCGQREDAEEVAQETLLSVFENFSQLREPERVRPWVFQIARNACLIKRRRSVFAPSPSKELSLDELMPAAGSAPVRREIADWRHLPDAEAMNAELRAHLESAIRALPELYRSVVLLRDVEGLSAEETAGILDVSTDVVKTRLHRGRLAIRKTLEQRWRMNAAVEGS